MNNQDKIFNIIKKRTSKKFDKSTEINFLGFDSLDLVELVMEIEEELNVKIPDDKLSNIKTIGDLLIIVNDL
ncbi:MAG: acyl carrier protein [Mycoplasmataceae bacterium]|nr:acyl carrier protein [Mycoplasmataceae bacterium]